MSGDAPDALVYDLYQQGCTKLADGNARGAAEVLELAVEHEPAKASLRETLGRAYLAAAQAQQARIEFERVLELDPSDDYAHFGLGHSLERLGRLAEARTHFKLACALAVREAYTDALSRVRRRLEA
jgi:Flp pilus assembly protein TadD